jgi:hypothetical protein
MSIVPGTPRRRWRPLCSWFSRTLAGSLVMTLAVLSAGVAAAQDDDPFDSAAPSSAGMPGKDLVVMVLSWGMWLGLAACGLAILYGAATWAGFGSSSAGRAVHGKTYVFAGLIGAAVIGLAPTAVSMLFDAGSG